MKNKIYAVDISEFLNSKLIGEDIPIQKVTTLDEFVENTFSFVNKDEYVENNKIKKLYIVTETKEIKENTISTYIRVKNPRLAFAKVLNNFFITVKNKGQIHPTSQISENSIIGKNVSIGKNCTIGENVSIGNNTTINNNVVLYDNTIIGENCYIKSGAIIGEEGFGFEYEEDKTPIQIPHIGNVIIGDRVEIGVNTCISRGTIGSTIIHDDVKIDNLVQISHNCNIGQKTLITSTANISGSVTIGERCWIAPNSSIINKIKIGNDVTVGIGARVIRSIEDGKTVTELYSTSIEKLGKFILRTKYGR